MLFLVVPCYALVQLIAEHFGESIRQVVSRRELESWIEDGISVDDLESRIGECCKQISGLYLGDHPVEDFEIPVRLPETLRSKHMYVVGKSGSGKTTLLANMILQDLEHGHGLAILAPEQELLTEEIFPFLPEHRLDDVIYINPKDTQCPVILNPLEVAPGEDLDLKVDETTSILHRLFDDEGRTSAPRMETLLRHGLYALMQVPGTTLLDFLKLLDRNQHPYRSWLLGQVQDEEIRHFWAETFLQFPKDAHLPLINRLGRFLKPTVIRSILCSPGKSLNVRKAMDAGKVLCFNLADGILGETNSRVLGQLVLAKLQLAAMSRADIPKESRRPFYIYLDEFQSFVNVATTSYEKLLSRARKFNIGLVLAHQQVKQVPEPLIREILGNVASLVSFQLGASDATRLSKEFVSDISGTVATLDSKELLTLRIGESFAKIGRSVLFMRTPPPPEYPDFDLANTVIEASRVNYGTPVSGTTPAQSALGFVDLEDLDPESVFG